METRTNAPGWLIVLEGIDGAGKTTIAQRLARGFTEIGLSCRLTKEPTDGPWGQRLRESAQSGRLSLKEELELFQKDRAAHVADLILPALTQGHVVILDRYYFSTAAYQGARGVDPIEVLKENERFAPIPDLVLLLDCEPSQGLARVRLRGDIPNAFEREEALAKVRAIFLSLERSCIRQINAAQAIEKVWADCQAALPETLSAVLNAQKNFLKRI